MSVALVILLFATVNTSIAPPGVLINPASCYEIEGTVIDKTDNRTLWVELDYMEEVRGYKVHVSEEAYNSYIEGESYNQIVCDYFKYVRIQDYIDNLTNWGLVEIY